MAKWDYMPVGRGARLEFEQPETAQGEKREPVCIWFEAEEFADFFADTARMMDDVLREETK